MKKIIDIVEIVKENQTPIGLRVQIRNTRCTLHTFSSIVNPTEPADGWLSQLGKESGTSA